MSPHCQLLLLDDADTILVCIAMIVPGEPILIDGAAIVAPEAVDVGHKIARRALRIGDKVIKHGAPIGSITADTAPGGWVHVHNMKSDYIATHGRGTASAGDG